MHLLNTILFCSALVSATPRLFSWANAINQLAPRGALYDKSLARMTVDQVETSIKQESCWHGTIPWPQNDLPTPLADKPSKELNIYKKPATTPGQLTVHNYCDYDIHYQHLPDILDARVLKAGATFTSPLDGTVWKGSKTADMVKVVLIEYANKGTLLWYNLSLIKCLGVNPANGLPTTDTSGCAGHEAGLQFGNEEVMVYQCAPGVWCDDQAYLYDVSPVSPNRYKMNLLANM
jgi:hypothetical protein